ncbi:MAG: hypothetical protein QMD09_03580 [Desulfatibacillaceae bacterium]|nr:hypothetical protein [Desulfatibacillaceae bacterium]
MLSRKKSFLALLLAAIFLLPSTGAGAAGPSKLRTFEVTGGSRIFSGNVTNARQQAISNAWDAAVARAVLSLVSSQAVQANFPILAQTVYNQGEQFVENFQPLAESQSDGFVRVLVQVTVNLDSLKERLIEYDILTRAEQKPILLVLLDQQAASDERPTEWWSLLNEGRFPSAAQQAAVNQLAALGFLPVGGAQTLVEMLADSQNPYPPFPMPDIDRLAEVSGAQVLVTGSSVVRLSGNSMGRFLEAYEAGVTLKAVGVKAGRELASASHTLKFVAGTEGGQTVEDALGQAAAAAANELAEKLMASWREMGSTKDDLRLRVVNIRQLKNLVDFRRILKDEISGVNALIPRRMTDREAEMAVAYSGSVHELARLIILQDYAGFGVKVNQVADKSLEVEFVAP